MPPPDRGPVGPSGSYFLWFGSTALTLVALTLILVLGVLPRRYVLNSGLRESGVNFPATRTPFTPSSESRRAPPPLPVLAEAPSAASPAPGPAELLWQQVDALRARDRLGEALPVFEAYLQDHPDDAAVRREYALALQGVGRWGEAAGVMAGLLRDADDPDLRRILARTLRDLGRLDEADHHYGVLRARNPNDLDLVLEWARAHSWAREYGASESILRRALADHPEAGTLRAELARVYYQWDRLADASGILEALDDGALDEAGVLGLRDEVRAARAPSPPPEAGAATPLDPAAAAERAVADARWDDAARAFERALARDAGRPDVWIAYADVLQFRLDDLPGARRALLEAEALTTGPVPRDLAYRLAQLSAWTDDLDDARGRLDALLMGAPLPRGESPDPVEVQAFLGDVLRWRGDRLGAVRAYETALAASPGNDRARVGLDEVQAQVRDQLWAAERPRLGADAYSLADSDEFLRVDLGAVGVHHEGSWSIRTRSGTRRLRGRDLTGGTDAVNGVFVEVEPALWWRWGTVRTGLLVGWENVVPGGSDLFAGASLRMTDVAGVSADLRYDHGPAYPQTTTLESALAGVDRDRVSAVVRLGVTPLWSVSLALDASWLEADATRVAATGATARVEASVTLMRDVNPWLDAGLDLRALRFTHAAPLVEGRPLFWDPDRVWAAGMVLRGQGALAARWGLDGTVRSGLAVLDERRMPDTQVVPHVSVELGLFHRGDRIRTELGAFFLQSRFDGYRSAGLRFGLSALTGSNPGGTP